ncbi:hypothetical protein T484DRAFT_1815152 [Baffinella frigidus]|nr:hypothetical protein T484DRAFT_1815152 [Cryptophyta sp. CCMP2293]
MGRLGADDDARRDSAGGGANDAAAAAGRGGGDKAFAARSEAWKIKIEDLQRQVLELQKEAGRKDSHQAQLAQMIEEFQRQEEATDQAHSNELVRYLDLPGKLQNKLQVIHKP